LAGRCQDGGEAGDGAVAVGVPGDVLVQHDPRRVLVESRFPVGLRAWPGPRRYVVAERGPPRPHPRVEPFGWRQGADLVVVGYQDRLAVFVDGQLLMPFGDRFLGLLVVASGPGGLGDGDGAGRRPAAHLRMQHAGDGDRAGGDHRQGIEAGWCGRAGP
jgi:hypothetical protein